MQKHTPVLLKEISYFLDVVPGKRYIDATVGSGGHTESILKSGGDVLGIDQDPKSLDLAKKRLKACPGVFKAISGNFSKIKKIAFQNGWKAVDGIIFDLGVASFQIEDQNRGLSFSREGPLDMRLDPSLGVTAADLVNSLPEKALFSLFSEIGQERLSRSIAKRIVEERVIRPFKTTSHLANLIQEVYKNRRITSKGHINPATRVFMALRIAVNTEFENLRQALPDSLDILKKGGKIAVISFHSGEDRIVKNFFRERAKNGILKILTDKPVVPSDEEQQRNKRARSAKLRVAEKI